MPLRSFVSRKLVLSLAITAFGLAVVSASAWATFPGTNGRIAFASNATGDLDIYTMNPDGSGIADVANVSSLDAEPDYSPDGSKIVFRSGRTNTAEIYTMNANGAALTRLTFDSFRDAFPAWSPDGSMIAFESNRSDPNFATCVDTGTCNEDIFVIPATGGSPVQLTFDSGHDRYAQFSPDGKFVAYESNMGGAYAIYKVDVDTLAVTKLTTDSLQAGEPDWSPDGTKITFINNEDCSSTEPAGKNAEGKDCRSDIFVMNADGGSVTQLTQIPANNVDPTWSSQGDKIVFTHVDNFQFKRQQIWVMNPDGTGITKITRNNDNNLEPDWGSG